MDVWIVTDGVGHVLGAYTKQKKALASMEQLKRCNGDMFTISQITLNEEQYDGTQDEA